MISISKGEGCGNTFLIYDYLESQVNWVEDKSKIHAHLLMENRDDALILVKEFKDDRQLVLTMIVLEPDGSLAEFCGNGARVVCCYLKSKYGSSFCDYFLKTSRGLRKIWWEDEDYFIEMGKTKLYLHKSKFIKPELHTYSLGLGTKKYTFYWTETLEPHLVTFNPMDSHELYEIGNYLNLHEKESFPLGVNLNKVDILSDSHVNVMTFERGVNRITAACGTGATSSVRLAMEKKLISPEECKVTLLGGALSIKPHSRGSLMIGPASLT